MNELTVFQILLSHGTAYSTIRYMIDTALEFGSATAEWCEYRLVNTNSGMPAEFRIEKI
jgi:hypothetical protein